MQSDAKRGPSEASIETFELSGRAIDLTAEAVWSALRCGGFLNSAVVGERFDELFQLGRFLIDLRALARLPREGELEATERSLLPAPIRDAEHLWVCVATAGEAIDRRARAFREEGDVINSMILDAIAMAGLSSIAERLGRKIFEWAADRRLAASRSFAPGAGASHWDLEHQRLVFDHLPDRPLGVELTDRFLMRPSKSLSFVIGVGGGVEQACLPFSCAGCARVDCAYRHIPKEETVRGAETESGRSDGDPPIDV